ncbi:STAS domain-containing protein [Metabacillus indicus]|uniref:STAS domain-containing protein n=1 Tax=Metabacillus indicus TaxID=246786 RepID=UPI002A039CFC|nr:STAS domain-containing protein [Metabacillus indicus]MDX8289391.1 STAS domain-containing protein [Metabacillus indicus]
MLDGRHLPLPFFKLDKNFRILERSLAAGKLFAEKESFLELADEDSRRKAEIVLSSGKNDSELVLRTYQSPLSLFKLNVNTDDEFLYLILTEQNSKMETLVQQVELHRRRLAETDLQLLAKKEEAEDAYRKIIELSCPFIMLTKKTALLPLYGELTEELISANAGRLLNLLQETCAEQVMIDFHGVGFISETGMKALADLVKEFTLMGASTCFASLNPVQAKQVYASHTTLEATYVSSLSCALETYLL